MADRHFQTQQEQTVRCADIVTDGTDTLLYIFNSERSFVVIAGDHRVVPVLACSDHQLYNREDISAPAQMWIDSYAAQIRDLKKHVSRNSQAHPAWTQWLSRGMRDDAVVKPMMMSHWGQETFYNYYCPRDYAGDNGNSELKELGSEEQASGKVRGINYIDYSIGMLITDIFGSNALLRCER